MGATMGVLGASKVLHQVGNLSINNLSNFCLRWHEQQSTGGPPSAVIDASYIGLRAPGSMQPVTHVLQLLKTLLNAGFKCHIVFDPPTRHHTKCASIKRCGERESSRLEAYSARCDAVGK